MCYYFCYNYPLCSSVCSYLKDLEHFGPFLHWLLFLLTLSKLLYSWKWESEYNSILQAIYCLYCSFQLFSFFFSFSFFFWQECNLHFLINTDKKPDITVIGNTSQFGLPFKQNTLLLRDLAALRCKIDRSECWILCNWKVTSKDCLY